MSRDRRAVSPRGVPSAASAARATSDGGSAPRRYRASHSRLLASPFSARSAVALTILRHRASGTASARAARYSASTARRGRGGFFAFFFGGALSPARPFVLIGYPS